MFRTEIIAILLLLGVHLVAGQTDTCAAQTTLAQCFAETRSGKLCVFRESCIKDPCRLSNTQNSCLQTNPFCVWQPISLISCFDQQILCSSLSAGSCESSPLCRARDDFCQYSVPEATGAPSPNAPAQCAGFPGWSIALLIVWLGLMGVLVFIILLIRKKSRQDSVTGVERSEVQIESVHLDRGLM